MRAPFFLLLSLAATAGCLGESYVPTASAPPPQASAPRIEPFHDEQHHTVNEGQRYYVPYKILAPAQFTYKLTSSGGTASVYVMEGDQVARYAQGQPFTYYPQLSAESTRSHTASGGHNGGEIAIGFTCITKEPCKIDMYFDSVALES